MWTGPATWYGGNKSGLAWPSINWNARGNNPPRQPDRRCAGHGIVVALLVSCAIGYILRPRQRRNRHGVLSEKNGQHRARRQGCRRYLLRFAFGGDSGCLCRDLARRRRNRPGGARAAHYRLLYARHGRVGRRRGAVATERPRKGKGKNNEGRPGWRPLSIVRIEMRWPARQAIPRSPGKPPPRRGF